MKDKIINNEYNTVTEFKVRNQFYSIVICVNKALTPNGFQLSGGL